MRHFLTIATLTMLMLSGLLLGQDRAQDISLLDVLPTATERAAGEE